MRTFAVGDIHGRYDCLVKLLSEIESRAPAPIKIVFLGDYIDRGPQSREVIDLLMRGPSRQGDEWVCLKGNHEAMMLEVRAKPNSWWLNNGGRATLESFDMAVPANVMNWCECLPVYHETDHHFFVHAGIRPGVPLDKQDEQEMMWIRGQFSCHEGPHPKHIVHGHDPNDEPELEPHRTNLDTCAFRSGVLTAAEFDVSRASGPVAVIQGHQCQL